MHIYRLAFELDLMESKHRDLKERMSEMTPEERKHTEVERLHKFETDSSQWGEWNERVHKSKDQINRQHRAYDLSLEMRGNREAMADAANGVIHGYTVRFSNCSCPDFEERRLPCKHIYADAMMNNIQLHLKEAEYLRRREFLNFS